MLTRIALIFLSSVMCCAPVLGQGVPVTLQWFETSWQTMEDRTADAFLAGYGRVWTPPIFKADTGPTSIGYDVFDRFDLGSPGSPTRYGTQAGFQAVIAEQNKAVIRTFIDLIPNHNGFRDNNTPGFEASGGYPGFVLSHGGDTHGDFHERFDDCGANPIICRIAGLIDIAQEKNHVMIRHPVEAGNPQNIPPGTVRNQPNPANRQFYSDQDLPANSIGIRPFNIAEPMDGDPVAENATGLLLRNIRWLLEVIGVDGFRIDAVKHTPDWFFRDFYDRHVWQRGQPNIAGTPTTPFSFGELFDGNTAAHEAYVCKGATGNCNTAGGVTGNRDTLDFPLYFAMRNMLNANGFGSWTSVVNASVDSLFDGNANNGNVGVQFVEAHDSGTEAPAIDNVAYAYILMRAGSPIVYFQAAEFGSVSFPRPGRGDSLGGQFGNLITTLVDIHNEYARGSYIGRSIDNDVLVFERNNACLVGLNDRRDGGYDQRTVTTNFSPGLRLKELTGNAADPLIDPNNDIAEVLSVGTGGQVTLRVPRNRNANNVQHNRGYVIYGPFNPEGELTVSNVASVIPPDSPSKPNGTRRLAEISVIQADSFEVRLETVDADPIDTGEDDLALLRINAGMDLNGNGVIDHLDPNFVGFGYENFVSENLPLKSGGVDIGGVQKGLYRQVIDTTQLPEGRSYLSVIAFRSRPGGAPPIFQTWRKVLLIDRVPPEMALHAPAPGTAVTASAYQIAVRSIDRTASQVHLFLDQQPGTDVIALAQAGQGLATNIDRGIFNRTFTNLTAGNHRLDVVAYEPTRSEPSVSTFPVPAVINGFDGLGDMNGDGKVTNRDIFPFIQMVQAGNQFSPAGDLNGDGIVDTNDVPLFAEKLLGAGVPQAMVAEMIHLAQGEVDGG